MGIDFSVYGLRTKESKEFTEYFNYVQAEAKKRDMVFFLDCADGNNDVFEDMQVVDLAGWLLPNEKVAEFRAIWEKFEEDDDWVDYFCFAEYEIEGKHLKIEFKYY